MVFEYITENVNEILQNPDSVLYIRPYEVDNKKALFAMVSESKGVYKKVQLTKERSKLFFPHNPLLYFREGPGNGLVKRFLFCDNYLALSIKNLDGFQKVELKDKYYKNGIFATFEDGSATIVIRKSDEKYEKEGGVKGLIDVLKFYKEYEPKHQEYKNIESYDEINNTIIIPELQENIDLSFEQQISQEQPQVKKLVKKRKPNKKED